MVNTNKRYGLLVLNLFILLPLIFETHNPSLAISFSGLAYILCPVISLFAIHMLINPYYPKSTHSMITLLGHSMILVYILVRFIIFNN